MLILTNLMGETTQGTADDPRRLLDELQHSEAEHPDVSAATEDGVCLSVFPGYRVALEDVENDTIEPCHADGLSADDVARLAANLESEGPDALAAAADWQPGY